MRRQSTAGEVAKFALSGLAAVILLAFGGVELLRHIGTTEAIRDAKQLTELAGRGIIEPLADGLETGDPTSVSRVDRAVRRRILRDGVVRVKIWTRDGRIVYSDERRLIGARYSLGEDEIDAIADHRVDAEVSDLSQPENRLERRYGKLLEVYLPIRDSRGTPLLFETYQRFSSVSSSGRHLWLAFLPAILGALVLLELVQVPLALRLARRLRRGQEERETLLRRAIEASDVERRRIAQDLHDGAVQSLAGVSYSLAAAADRGDDGAEPLRKTLRDAAAGTRQAIRELRTLLVEIYPPDLHRTGLEAALRDLVAPLASHGIEAEVEYADGNLPPELETVFFRCAQEALRNVLAHARARHVEVRVHSDAEEAQLTVADDGRGFEANGGGEAGHIGLRVLRDLASDIGGELRIESEPGRGTRVTVEAPLP